MAMQCADGTITLTTGAIGTTFTVSGLAFQPKALFLFWSGRATTGQGEADHKFGAGFAVSTTSRRNYSTQSDHGVTTSAADRIWHNDCCVSTLSVAGASAGKADLDAITADGFRLIIDKVFAAGLQVGWIAYGGSDITNVEIVDIVSPTATGNQDITTSFALDTGLDDKAIIFLGVNGNAAATPAVTSSFVMGVAAGNTPVNATLSGRTTDAAATSVTDSYCRTGECLGSGAGASTVLRASLTAWLATGFRLNWAEVLATGYNHSALVIKGGRWEVGNSLTSTGVSNQTEATTYVPKALLIASHGKAQSTVDTFDAHDERIIGVATSATSRRCAAVLDKDAAATMDIGIAFSETAMYINQSTAATIVQEGAMDLVSFDSTPGFTYVMDDADPVAAFFWYLLAADAPQVYTRTLSDSINASDGTVRGARAFRQMPADAVSLLDSLLRSQQHGRVLGDAASVNDTAQRVALLFHGLTDSVEVGDSLLRTARMFRQTADSIAISDEARRAIALFRQTTDSLDVRDDVLRFAKLFRRLLDDVTATDMLIVTLTLAGVTIVTRILQDNLSVTDAVQRAVRMYRRESQAVDVQDGTWYSTKIVRSVTETLAVADSVARMLLLTRTVTDNATAADAALRFALLNRLAREDVEATDSLASQITYFQQLLGFVLQSMRSEPVVMSLEVASALSVDMRREGNAAVALDKHGAQLTFARHQPILMEMRNL